MSPLLSAATRFSRQIPPALSTRPRRQAGFRTAGRGTPRIPGKTFDSQLIAQASVYGDRDQANVFRDRRVRRTGPFGNRQPYENNRDSGYRWAAIRFSCRSAQLSDPSHSRHGRPPAPHRPARRMASKKRGAARLYRTRPPSSSLLPDDRRSALRLLQLARPAGRATHGCGKPRLDLVWEGRICTPRALRSPCGAALRRPSERGRLARSGISGNCSAITRPFRKIAGGRSEPSEAMPLDRPSFEKRTDTGEFISRAEPHRAAEARARRGRLACRRRSGAGHPASPGGARPVGHRPDRHGKTAAFGCRSCSASPRRATARGRPSNGKPRVASCWTPTRELAIQIGDSFRAYGGILGCARP